MEDLAYLPSEGGIKLIKLPSSFANLLEVVFCGFGKNFMMPSTFSMELLQLCRTLRCMCVPFLFFSFLPLKKDYFSLIFSYLFSLFSFYYS